MSVEHFDLVITGSGFAGSLMAMIARRLGYSVILLEKGSHPRFVIGESSTPLTNLLLETIATEYNLPRLLPFSKWGSWQKQYPKVACGLKRGFSFFHHTPGKKFERSATHENELLVAASPNDRIADTHWYRPDFDLFLVKEAQALGVEYRDQVVVTEFVAEEDFVDVRGTSRGQQLGVRASQLIDASGPNGFIKQQLNLPLAQQNCLLPTEGLYTHFEDVPLLETVTEFQESSAPYPSDASAVHHLFDGGWVWVLRFNNRITSAGVSATREFATELNLSEGEPAWHRLLSRYPSLQRAFEGARPILPFRHHASLPFRFDQLSSKNWLLLPSAAAFVDPLLSTGFPLTLLGVLRVAELLKNRESHYVPALEKYFVSTSKDLDAVELLIGALFRSFHDPQRFRWLSFLYFAPMLHSEAATRLGRRRAIAGFLMRDDPIFWPAAKLLLEEVIDGHVATAQLEERVTAIIAPLDLGGLLDNTRQNWYPADSFTLIRNAAKAGVPPAEMESMLQRVGA
jgi:tetracycline 7-halogenase / FADH2 O2-dependent halogenase